MTTSPSKPFVVPPNPKFPKSIIKAQCKECGKVQSKLKMVYVYGPNGGWFCSFLESEEYSSLRG